MLHEMVSAPVPRGLFNGTSGFCPVAATNGMPRELIQLLADLSKRQYETVIANKSLGREMYCYLPLTVKGKRLHLVTHGLQPPRDEQLEQKYIVHQLLLENVRDLPAGPAWLLANDQVWISQWNVEPQYLEPRQIKSSVLSPRICETWTRVTGDAGWAGAALEAWQKRKPFVLIVPADKPTRPIIDMMVEAQSLMEPHLRWEMPISILSWHPTKNLQRIWAAYQAGTQQAISACRSANCVTLEITRKLEPAANSFSEVARSGSWARFHESDNKRTKANNQAGDNAKHPLFDGPDVTSVDGLLAPLELPATSRGTEKPLSPSKGRLSWTPQPRALSRQVLAWTKRGLVVAVLVLVGFGIWKGTQLLRAVAAEIGNAKPPQHNQPNANDELAITGSEQIQRAHDPDPSENGSVAVSIVSAHSKRGEQPEANDSHADQPIEEPTLTSAAAERLLQQLHADCPYLEFPVTVSDREFLAFTLLGTESLFGELGFGLATPHQFLALERVADKNAWTLCSELSGSTSSFQATLSLAVLADESGDQVQFLWNWQKPPDNALASEIKSGALVVWLLSDPKISGSIPLAPPILGDTTNAIDAMFEGIKFTPHLSTELARAETASHIKWSAEPIGFVKQNSTETESKEPFEALWEKINSTENMSLLRINSSKLAKEIEAAFPGTSRAKDEALAESLQNLIDRTSPIQLEVRMDIPSFVDAQKEAMFTRARVILFMKGDDGSTCSLIFQYQPRPEKKTRAQEFENDIKAALIRWMGVNFNLDQKLSEAMMKGKSFTPQPAATSEFRAKSAFAQALTQVIFRELHEELEFRAVRSTTLKSELGDLEIRIPAYLGKN